MFRIGGDGRWAREGVGGCEFFTDKGGGPVFSCDRVTESVLVMGGKARSVWYTVMARDGQLDIPGPHYPAQPGAIQPPFLCRIQLGQVNRGESGADPGKEQLGR